MCSFNSPDSTAKGSMGAAGLASGAAGSGLDAAGGAGLLKSAKASNRAAAGDGAEGWGANTLGEAAACSRSSWQCRYHTCCWRGDGAPQLAMSNTLEPKEHMSGRTYHPGDYWGGQLQPAKAGSDGGVHLQATMHRCYTRDLLLASACKVRVLEQRCQAILATEVNSACATDTMLPASVPLPCSHL